MGSIFDGVADIYASARPSYPEVLFDDLLRLTETPSGGRVLEVGAGTGQATEPLLRRGLSVLALEPGTKLADIARSRLAAFPHARVVAESFEDWGIERGAFDLVVSGTAFHWVDQEVGYRKASDSLKPGGSIGLFWNRHVSGEPGEPAAAFQTEVDALYRRWAPALVGNLRYPSPEEVTGDEHIEASGLFGRVTVRRYRWQEAYDARRYTDLLRTYSDHIELASDKRDGLLAGIESLISGSYGGRILLDRVSVLYVARRN